MWKELQGLKFCENVVLKLSRKKIVSEKLKTSFNNQNFVERATKAFMD